MASQVSSETAITEIAKQKSSFRESEPKKELLFKSTLPVTSDGVTIPMPNSMKSSLVSTINLRATNLEP